MTILNQSINLFLEADIRSLKLCSIPSVILPFRFKGWISAWVFGSNRLDDLVKGSCRSAAQNFKLSGASAVSDGHSKSRHIIFMIAGYGQFSEAKSANIQFLGCIFPLRNDFVRNSGCTQTV